jgi:ribose transport system substrate-binding protein
MFQANPDVNVVYAHNDPMAEAAIISAQNAGLNQDDMLFIGIDGLPTPDGGIRSVLDGRIDVTYVYPTGGAQAIDYATQILEQGVVPPDQIVLETEQVEPDNAQALLEKYGGAGAPATPSS